MTKEMERVHGYGAMEPHQHPERARLRSIAYGFYRTGEPKVAVHCSRCGKELEGQFLKINGESFCYSGCAFTQSN